MQQHQGNTEGGEDMVKISEGSKGLNRKNNFKGELWTKFFDQYNQELMV